MRLIVLFLSFGAALRQARSATELGAACCAADGKRGMKSLGLHRLALLSPGAVRRTLNAVLPHAGELRSLHLTWCTSLDDGMLEHLSGSLPSLTELGLVRCPLISERGVRDFVRVCTSLRELDLSYSCMASSRARSHGAELSLSQSLSLSLSSPDELDYDDASSERALLSASPSASASSLRFSAPQSELRLSDAGATLAARIAAAALPRALHVVSRQLDVGGYVARINSAAAVRAAPHARSLVRRCRVVERRAAGRRRLLAHLQLRAAAQRGVRPA